MKVINKYVLFYRACVYGVFFCLITLFVVEITIFKPRAERFDKTNSEELISLVGYSKDKQGFWIKRPVRDLDKVPDIGVKFLAKNNKLRQILLMDSTHIYAVTLDKHRYNEFKKEKSLVNLKDRDWENVFDKCSENLAEKFAGLNNIRSKEIDDSIKEEERLETLRLQELARLEALRLDSIREVERKKQEAEADEEYRKSNPKGVMDITSFLKNRKSSYDYSELRCIMPDCNYSHKEEVMTPIILKEDTLVIIEFKEGPLEITYGKGHAIIMNDRFKKTPSIKQHIRAWQDSLRKDVTVDTVTLNIAESVDMISYIGAESMLDKVIKKAPYGFVEDWGWEDNYGFVEFNAQFTNLNKKTIKYIRFFFTVYNDVGDVRGSGNVQGTGPIEQFETASWSWDYTGCRVAGDATKMKIKKIVITYMNGSTITLNENKIKYN